MLQGPSARPTPRTLTHLPACPKVYLAPNGSSVEYGSILVERNKRVKQDLVLSADLASLYAMTHDKVGQGAGPRPAVGVGPGSVGRSAGGVSVLGPQYCSCPSCLWSCLRPTLRGERWVGAPSGAPP